MDNKAGAIVERTRLAEDAMLMQFDQNAGNPVAVGEGQTHSPVQTCHKLVKFCISSGWSVVYRHGYITLTRGCGMVR